MKTISLTAAVLFAGAALGYDVHTKALTPIEEEARPAGSPMAFIRDGKIDFAIVADLKTEGTIGAKSDFSVRPAVRELTNAFVRCFGAAPDVCDFRAAGTACKAKYVLYVGDQPFVRELAAGGGNFYDGWMKNPRSAMISCNDGFRPVSFLLETIE